MIPAADLHVMVALSRAPVTKGFPAITPEFLALLKRCGATWEPEGIRVTKPKREPFCSFLMPFTMSKRSRKTVWWFGDSADRCTCSPSDLAFLLKGEALPDGAVRVEGQAMRLAYANGWARLVEMEGEVHFGGQRRGQPRAVGSYGAKITDARRAAQVTQARLAEQLGIAPSTLGCIERGEMRATRRMARAIDAALDKLRVRA